MASTRKTLIYVFCIFFACGLLTEVLDEISSPTEMTGIVDEDVVFQFNTTGNNAGIKAAKFGLDGNQSNPFPKFITVILKNGVTNITFGEDLNSTAASYKGRVSFVGNLKKGQAWFKISKLSVTDTNLYMCKIRQDSDDGYKRTNRIKLTVLEKDITPLPPPVIEAKYTDFEGLAKKNCKLLCKETFLVKNVLEQAYQHMLISHKIKMKPIRKIKETVTAWFHLSLNEAINRSYAISFLKLAQQNNRLRGYNITCFEKLDVKPVLENIDEKPVPGLGPLLIALFVFLTLAVAALVIFLAIWMFRSELLDPFYQLVRSWSTRLREASNR